MNRKKYILLALGLWLGFSLNAREEVTIDWEVFCGDTLLPCYTKSIDLGTSYSAYSYSATIEYPELQPLTEAQIQKYRLSEQNPQLPEWPDVQTYLGVASKRGQLDVSFIPILYRDGHYQRIVSFELVLHKQPAPLKVRQSSASQRYASHSVLASGKWTKIRVKESGVYMFTHKRLAAMGFKDPSKVRLYGYGGYLLPETNLQTIPDDLQEVPLWREADRVLFYANGTIKWTLQSSGLYSHTQNHYSSYAYYFLTESEEAPAAFPLLSAEDTERAVETTTFPEHALYEVESFSWHPSGRKLFDSYDYANGNVRTYAFALDNIDEEEQASVTISFSHSHKSEATTLSVEGDGTVIGSLSIPKNSSYSDGALAEGTFKANLSSSAAIRLTHKRASGVSGRLDFIRINYTARLKANGTFACFRSAVTELKTFQIANANAHTVVWRVTDAASIGQLSGSLQNDVYKATVEATAGDEFVAVNSKGSFPIPEVVGTVPNQDLHATDTLDYLIIVPSSGTLTVQAERLAEAHRTHDGLRVKVVPANQIYNEFSSGTPDATAYRRYLKMLYDRADTEAEQPKYLLLFGDGAWDNRMISSNWSSQSPEDYLLCYEAENSFSATRSYVMEDYFGLLDDGEGASLLRDKVDIGVGRFPVLTLQQAQETVDKTIAYMNNTYAGSWKNSILMLGDDGDNNQHMEDAEYVAKMLESTYPNYRLDRIYWDTYPMEVTATGNSYPAVRKRILERLNEGALMVNYSGHGSADVLSHELVINKSDMESLNSPRLPLWVTASCDISPFDNTATSFGEYAFLNPKGGAIALFTTSRTVFSSQNRRINYFFSKYVFGRDSQNRRFRLGDAVRKAKCELITTSVEALQDFSENKLQYVLLGDPALQIGTTNYRVVVDELNGIRTDGEEVATLKAGSKVLVKGHIADDGKTPVPHFNGTVYPVVQDNKETIVARNNAGTATTVFSYEERVKTLYAGSDSVRGGQFSFTFRVPLDINYSYKDGLLNLYALSDAQEEEAQGIFSDFLLGNTEENLENDSTGPQIALYLNSPEFENGGKVNETPYLVARLQDEDGINTSGNGIGHDIMAMIDNSALYTYTLNNYYQSDFGDYTRGTVTYSLPSLPEGKHTLQLRAWDMMNNSSSVALEFEVVAGLRPHLSDVQSTSNPARTSTQFVITHDRPETEILIHLEVFDFAGRILWSVEETGVSSNNAYTVGWDLCGSAGQRLSPGVYLYRATISSASGKSSTQTRKLLILRE